MRRGQALLVCLCGLALAGTAGCGGDERQDANEPEGDYEVQVIDARFPERQALGQHAELEITVRNSGDEDIPDAAVTVHGFYRRLDDPDLADPNRPVFVVNGVSKQIGGYPEVKLDAPGGGQTALVDTWTLGKLKSGAERTFRWRVTAVRPGPFEVSYVVAAGLDGKARAVTSDGGPVEGSFAGTVSSRAPASRIAADGKSVVTAPP